MDQSHSQPSDALRFIHELRRAINDNSKEAAEVLEQDAQLWGELKRFLELIPAPADQTPPCEAVNIPPRTEQERLREELGNHLFDNSTPDEKKHLREAWRSFWRYSKLYSHATIYIRRWITPPQIPRKSTDHPNDGTTERCRERLLGGRGFATLCASTLA